ncbi:alpha/beta fold hydrolase [Dactylosporangium sp. NPDC048998]|uniref:alpha/beta fold hydrolase n=1 Tax=Dactylosporangium sp. NPDC048998 TaxID=3363976 RepID=UPI00370F776C
MHIHRVCRHRVAAHVSSTSSPADLRFFRAGLEAAAPWATGCTRNSLECSMTTPKMTDRERRQYLTAVFADVLDRPHLDLGDDFFALGGDDAKAGELVRRVRREWGVDLDRPVLREHPTVAGLLGFLSARYPLPDPKVVLALRRQGGQPPLFCLHAGSGFGVPYMGLQPNLDADVPVYALQARGLVGDLELPASLDEMADDYTEQIRRVRPHGPYRLLGWCLGGRLAFEIGCRLRAVGEPVELVALLSAFPPDGAPLPDAEVMLRNMLTPPALAEADPELAALCRLPLDHAALHEYFQRTAHPMRRFNARSLAATFEVYRNNERLVRTPVRRTFDGTLLCLVAAQHEPAAAVAAWRPFVTGEVDARQLPCRHGEMMEPEPLRAIGAVLSAALRPHEGDHGEETDE